MNPESMYFGYEHATREVSLRCSTIQAIMAFEFDGSLSDKIDQIVALAKQARPVKAREDLTAVPDSELAGKKPGYAAERIRRAVLAVQRYNEQQELADQIEINAGSLRALAAASPAAVGAYVAEHASELAAYAAAMNHPGSAGKQNRGKDIAALVPLDWNS